MHNVTSTQKVCFLLSPLEKQIIRNLFYNKKLNTQEYQYAVKSLMHRLDCEHELELGIWAAQNAKAWANKNDLVELNLFKYQAKQLKKRIVIKTEDR